jgi:hypothetical protein
MQTLFEQYQTTDHALPIQAITATRYRLPTQSVYAF